MRCAKGVMRRFVALSKAAEAVFLTQATNFFQRPVSILCGYD